MVFSKERYVTRLKAMHTMSLSDANGGEAQAAKERFEAELSKFAQFGFKSEAEVKANLSEESTEVFLDDEFVKMDFSMGGKRVAKWKTFLLSACAMQQQCQQVSVRGGVSYLFGPKSRIDNTVWLYEQLVQDIEKNCDAAWNRLTAEERKMDNKRSFKTSYGLAVAIDFHKQEYDRKQDRKQAYYSQKANSSELVNVSSSLDVRSEKFARSMCNFGSRKTQTTSRSSNGRSAGESDSGRVSNRRMTGGARRLSAG